MSVVEQAGRVGSAAVESMKSVPLAIALLVVNACFIGFVAYVLSIVGQNAVERERAQVTLVSKLVDDIRDCRKPGG
jgi:hypothetical protein